MPREPAARVGAASDRIQLREAPSWELRTETTWQRWLRPLAGVGAAALGFAGLLVGIYYVAGLVAAGIVAVIVALLVVWGNWVLDNIIPL